MNKIYTNSISPELESQLPESVKRVLENSAIDITDAVEAVLRGEPMDSYMEEIDRQIEEKIENTPILTQEQADEILNNMDAVEDEDYEAINAELDILSSAKE